MRQIASLRRRSVRRREGLFLAEGPQAVREAIDWRPDVVCGVYVDSAGADRCPDLLERARTLGLRVHEVTPPVLTEMADTATPQGLLAVCRRLDVALPSVLAAGPRLLVLLAQVRDPGNAGTVVRGADTVGADAVLVGAGSVDVYNPKVVRSTAGSLFHLPIVVGVPVPAVLGDLSAAGIATYAADATGPVRLPDADLDRPHAWVLGNEAWGLPAEVRDACDAAVAVPLRGRAESLNLAMAATICLYASSAARG